jgi:hypothetical protein
VNIFLIPYTWMRHFAVALVSAGAGLLAWWLSLALTVWMPVWSLPWDGAVYLGFVTAFVAGTSVLAESSLHREAVWRRTWRTAAAAGLSGVLCVAAFALWTGALAPVFGGVDPDADVAEPTLVSLRWRLPAFLAAGVCTAIGPLVLRRGKGFVSHIGAGAVSGLAAATSWYGLGYLRFIDGTGDLYLAGAIGALVLGGTFGLYAWPIPDSLYAGWMRVLTDTRQGRRIPVDAPDGAARERFIGHFPRGLDLFLPASDGVMELHASVLRNARGEYRVRGLTLQPTTVQRFLERIDLRYDAQRPAPLETRLSSGDRLVLGPPENPTVVEFVMLPREER